jgi:putative SOS response-associated peptidase YedK
MEDEILEMREILNEINERYKDAPEAAAAKTGEVFPTDTAPVLIRAGETPQALLMKWGFPKPPQRRYASSGAPILQGSGVVINARAETAQDKISFRPSLSSRRCVVPTTGFFEWRQDDGKKKTKYLFRLPETKMLYLAGLYNTFKSEPAPYEAYVILTTTANPSVAPYHDRMPLVLTPDNIDAWLTDTAFAYEYVQRLCRTMLEAAVQ